jgi:arginine decarboxylase-like protein
VIKASEILSVRPVIGVRARLGTHHSGHWGSTSGDNGKFGLTISDIIKVVYRLEKVGRNV